MGFVSLLKLGLFYRLIEKKAFEKLYQALRWEKPALHVSWAWPRYHLSHVLSKNCLFPKKKCCQLCVYFYICWNHFLLNEVGAMINWLLWL